MIIDPDKFEGFRISVSGLREFIHCQRKYELSSIAKIERKKKSSNLAFGTAIHLGAEPLWNEKHHRFEAAWSKFEKDQTIEYKHGGSWNSLLAKGRCMSDALANGISGKIAKNPFIELSDPVMVGETLITRRLDFVGEVNNLPAIIDGEEKKLNGPVIIDLKTASRKYGPLDGQTSLQLRGYMLPLNSYPNLKPKHAVFLVVTKTIKPQIQVIGTRIDQESILKFQKSVNAVAAQVKLKQFSENRGTHCSWCDFYDLCYKTPDWKKLYKKREAHGNVQKANNENHS